MTEKAPTRCKIIAEVARIALEKYKKGNPDGLTNKELIELCRLYDAHRNPGNNREGNRKNLRNQKPKKNFDSLLGVKKNEGSN